MHYPSRFRLMILAGMSALLLGCAGPPHTLDRSLSPQIQLQQLADNERWFREEICRLANQPWGEGDEYGYAIGLSWREDDQGLIPGDFGGLVSLSYEMEHDRIQRHLDQLDQIQQQRSELCARAGQPQPAGLCRQMSFEIDTHCPHKNSY